MQSLGFWIFVSVCVASGFYSRVQQQRAKLDLLRASIEKGLPLDPAVIDKLMPSPYSSTPPNPQGLLTTSILMAGISLGMVIFAFVLANSKPQAFLPMLGSAALMLAIGAAMLVAWKVASRLQRKDAAASTNSMSAGQ